MRREWVFRSADENAVGRLSRALKISEPVARVLAHRTGGSETAAHDFLCADLSALPLPERFPDAAKAVSLARRALKAREKILIVGDYDADGLTSCALLYRCFKALGGEPQLHVPHRTQDGYGLKPEVVRRAHARGVKLLAAVDCGTTSFEELALARRLGIRTLVADHHELRDNRRPPADAFLNPLEPGCGYPSRELASVGVAFALVRALAPLRVVWEHLDLVALGTVADMAPLTGENRILVRAGLHSLSGTSKPGLRALLKNAKLEEKWLDPRDVSFGLAPPLNALGRMGSAEDGLNLLITEDEEEAVRLMRAVRRQNRARSEMEREAFRRALQKVSREIHFSRDRVIVLQDDRWHPGVIGIVATRLSRRFHRPAVVIAGDKGSARSIDGFHLVKALETLKEHLVAFGGHPAAAGLTIEPERVPAFREALNELARARILPEHLCPRVELDGELPLERLNADLLRDFRALAPFGLGNPMPVFSAGPVRIGRAEGSRPYEPWGIPLTVRTTEGLSFDALQPREMWAESGPLHRATRPAHLAYTPVLREGSDPERPLLELRDLRF